MTQPSLADLTRRLAANHALAAAFESLVRREFFASTLLPALLSSCGVAGHTSDANLTLADVDHGVLALFLDLACSVE